MGKTKLTQHLQSLSQKQLIDLVLQLYDADKSAQRWLDYYLQPDDTACLQQFKQIILDEFYPADRTEPKMRFAVCRQAIMDFKQLKPRPEALAELMVFYVETACRFACESGEMWEKYYGVLARNFLATMKLIQKNGLHSRFQPSLSNILHYAQHTADNFAETITAIYNAYPPAG